MTNKASHVMHAHHNLRHDLEIAGPSEKNNVSILTIFIIHIKTVNTNINMY